MEGINIEPEMPQLGEEVIIHYGGPLGKNAAADQVYFHFGYGTAWHNLGDIPMQWDAGNWFCEIVPEAKEINFCFRDGANNWDNNEGANWNLRIEK